MGSGIGQKGLALCSACSLYLWGRTLSAFMRPTVCHLRSVHRGFSLLVFLLSPILGRLIRVVALFCFVLHCLSSVVYTHPTATLHGINSLGTFLPRSIPQSLRFFVAILKRYFIALWIRRALIPPSPLAIAPPCLSNLVEDCCVVDIWRYLHPSSVGFTWTRWDGSLASCIDLFGVPFSWVPSVSSCTFIPCLFSDHCGVYLSLSIPDTVPPGPGLWKLNISILDDPDHLLDK